MPDVIDLLFVFVYPPGHVVQRLAQLECFSLYLYVVDGPVDTAPGGTAFFFVHSIASQSSEAE